jgi:putative colanic acid biosynthesis acetyltransferase WcaF
LLNATIFRQPLIISILFSTLSSWDSLLSSLLSICVLFISRFLRRISFITSSMNHQRLDLFNPARFDRGAGILTEIFWIIIKNLFFLSPWPWPSSFKAALLRFFGAKVGKSLYLRPRTNIHFPWKLSIGDHCWIGDRCEILNLETITLEDHVALAHDVYLAAASHDIKSLSMKYKNRPILIRRGSWIATRVFIGPGVSIGVNCVVGAGCIVTDDVPDDSLITACKPIVVGKRCINHA